MSKVKALLLLGFGISLSYSLFAGEQLMGHPVAYNVIYILSVLATSFGLFKLIV